MSGNQLVSQIPIAYDSKRRISDATSCTEDHGHKAAMELGNLRAAPFPVSQASEPAATRESITYTTVSTARKAVLIGIFCFAQFLEISSGAAVIPVLGHIAEELQVDPSNVQWVLSAYALSFAAFMLLAGRLADVFTARYVFCLGFCFAGLMSLGAGFAKSAIVLFIIRAFQGLGAACSIPPAIRLIVLLTPDAEAQGLALQLFAMAGGMAATFSTLIGGGIASNVNYAWIFWIFAIASLLSSILAYFLIPPYLDTTLYAYRNLSTNQKLAKIDLIGALLIALFLILLVFALTEGNRLSWASARVLVPLLIALVAVLPAFLVWEDFGRTRRGLEAALPLSLWKLPNFAVYFGATAASFYWYGTVYITYTTLWSMAYQYSPWKQAKLFLPLGLATLFQAGVTPFAAKRLGLKTFLSSASILTGGGSVLLANASRKDQYFSMVVPGQVLVGFGAGMVYICCSQALIQTGAPNMSGVLGAIWTSALQMGLVVAIAVSLALITGINGTDFQSFTGYRVAFYSMTVIAGIMLGLVLLFLRPTPARMIEEDSPETVRRSL